MGSVSVAPSSAYGGSVWSWGRVSHRDVPLWFDGSLAPPAWPSDQGPAPKAWSYCATEETIGGGGRCVV